MRRAMELRPGDKLGRYIVEALLGRGGMGSVYRARDSELGRLVALKVITGIPDDTALLRFKREARAACAFSHPNAATVFDVGTVDQRPYLVMELLEGETLRARSEDPAATTADKRRWLLEIASALEAAHQAGLVHRDVKPDNVIITKAGVAKLVDFGIARASAEPVDPSAPTSDASLAALTDTGGVIGSPAYMSPEQLRGGTLDGRADQFAWGVTAYETLVGRLPWGNKTSAFELAASILHEQPEPLTQVEADSDPTLGAAIMRCLERDAASRFSSMGALLRSVEAEPTDPTRVEGKLTAPTSITTTSAPSSPRRAWWPFVAALLAAVAGGSVYLARRGPAPTASSVETLAPPAPSAEMRRCKVEGCTPGNLAWCSASGERKACCAEGLMGTEAGRCVCPPGGSHAERMIAGGCAAADPEHSKHVLRNIRQNFSQLRACYEEALKRNPKLAGKLSLGFELTPSGVPYGVELVGVDVPDAQFQDCAVNVFIALRFPPPGDGHAKIVYPAVFGEPR